MYLIWNSQHVGGSYCRCVSVNRKRSYDAAFKLAAVEDAEKTTELQSSSYSDIELGTKFFIIHIIMLYAVIIFLIALE